MGVPSLSDTAAGEGWLLGGSVGGLPEAAARLPLYRCPTVRQAKEDICRVSMGEPRVQGERVLGPASCGAAQQPRGSLHFFPLIKMH